MIDRTIKVSEHINASPQDVIEYVADPSNRPVFLKQLKSVSDVKPDPQTGLSTWRWTFGVLGLEFEGTGRTTALEPGKRYSFETEGGIPSAWIYEASPENGGTRLSVSVSYEVPERAIPVIPTDALAESMRRSEAEKALANLKTILEP
jgi:uncharacterized membrane protein